MKKIALLPALLCSALLWLTSFQNNFSESPSNQPSFPDILNTFNQAKTYEHSRFDTALLKYQFAFEQWNSYQDSTTAVEKQQIANALFNMAKAFRHNQQPSKALEVLTSLETSLSPSIPPGDTLLLQLRLHTLAARQEELTSEELLTQLKALEKQLSNTSGLLDLHLILARTYTKNRQEKLALQYAEKTKALLESVSPTNKVPALLQLGYIYTDLGQIDSLNNCLSLLEPLITNDKNGASFYHLKSKSAQLQGIFNDIHTYASKAVDLGEKVYPGDMIQKGQLYYQLSIGFWRLGQIKKAILYCQKALNTYQIHKDTERANKIKLLLGTLYKDNFQYSEAEQTFEEFLSYCKENNDRARYYMTLNQLGLLKLFTEDYQESKDYLLRAFEAEKDYLGTINHPHICNTLFNLGRVHFNLGQYSIAETYFKQVLEIAANIPTHFSLISGTNFRLGKIKSRQQNYEQALQFFQEAIKPIVPSFQPTNLTDNPPLDAPNYSTLLLSNALSGKMAALYRIAQSSQEKQAIDNALFMADYTLQHIENLRSSFKTDFAKQKLMYLATDIYATAVKINLLAFEQKQDPDFYSAAFTAAEKTKAVILNEGIKATEAKLFGNIPDLILEKEENLRSDILKLEETINLRKKEQNNDDELVQLEKDLILKKEEMEGLIDRLEKNYPDYYQIKYDVDVAKVADVQQYLTSKPETALLEYMLQDSTLTIFAISKDTFLYRSHPLPPLFHRRLDTLQAILSNRTAGLLAEAERRKEFSRFVNHSRFFYQQLIEPFAQKLAVENYILVPDAKLGYLPFQILLTNQPDQSAIASIDYRSLPYLFLDRNLRYAYSATLLAQNARLKKPAIPYIGFAPVYDAPRQVAANVPDKTEAIDIRAGLDSLAYNQPEVTATHQLFGGRALLGSQATEAAFKQLAPSAAIIHLAMHTIIDQENPMSSKLLFTPAAESAEDGNLNAFELYNMQLSAELAVISACESGYGKIQKGEGILSLSRAFKYAGCPNIVLSLWKASDASTKNIMTSFFENLYAGQRKDIALKEARKAYLYNVKDDRLTHPFFWATLVLIGEESPLKINLVSQNYLWIGLGIAAILIAWFGWRWRKTR